MRIESEKWMRLVRDGAAQMGLEVNRQQALLFSRHARLLMQWNRKINLTAITDPVDIAVKHFLDALAPMKYIPAHGHLLDIGTGAGFPGIPLKIMRPRQPMTLIDSVRKKINFVKCAIRELSLQRIVALHTRAEALSTQLPKDDGFDIIVCRALTDLELAVRLAAQLLAHNGQIILYQGSRNSAHSTDPGCLRCHIDDVTYLQDTISYRLPIKDMARQVTILKPER
jgi:16S rRNA (guanine527-N7)-methyltransferase